MSAPAGLARGTPPPSHRPVGALRHEGEKMVNLAHIQGQMRASSIARITQLADEHPDEALGVIRRWLAPEEAA